VEVVSLELQQGASGKRKRVSGEAHKQEKRRHAVVEYVMEGLSEELFTELLEGLYYGHQTWDEAKADTSGDWEGPIEQEEEEEEW
jgi:hypothetical protein